MDKKELDVALTATLVALKAGNNTPETILYLGLGMDMTKWTAVREFMLTHGLVTISMNLVNLTPAGLEMAELLDDLVNQLLEKVTRELKS